MNDTAATLLHINRGHAYHEQNGIGFFTLPSFTRTGLVGHGCTARKGGVSRPPYDTLNLSFTRPEELRDTVLENYRLFAKAAGIPWGNMVMDSFEHGTTVLAVDRSHAGMGYLRPSLPPCDGLVTDDPRIALITGHADCLPLYLFDPARGCIGLAHAGWKGTLGKIGLVMARLMQQTYGANPEDMLAGVGPGICVKCFEVDEELGLRFQAGFPNIPCVLPGKPGKAQIDLPLAAAAQFLEAGIPPEHISLMDACTCEDPERLYSHRRDRGRTGGMAAFLRLNSNTDDAFLRMPPKASAV
ncbi:MAG TPA: peptidoglycan editing factor PgeF [Feifaniaceae bacterium]|nr:peptidoglycan editing factor PgeF [Feifaniaceae bacterium]